MELIRYKPGEAVRWLDSGAKDMLARAKKKGEGVLNRDLQRQMKQDLADVAGAVIDVGKGAMAELLHRQAQATEYVLSEDRFEILRPGSVKSVRYDTVVGISRRGDAIDIDLDSGAITVKVPVGWDRNGIEVAYDVLADELAARCKVNITQL
jgi:hypothetical protein